MEITGDVFIGIELTNQRSGFTCAVLDSSRRILHTGAVTPLEWQSMLDSSKSVIAAVNSPLTLNDGFMADAEYRKHLNVVPSKNRYTELRVCEYELIIRGLTPTRTPRDVKNFTASLQKALKFSSELGSTGFQFWPSSNSRKQMFETQADACYWSLLGIKPFSSSSLEGRIQRQLALQAKNIPVPDAMEFFEEVTRHRLLSGKLPDERVFSPQVLNALAAAYTAWVAGNRPAEYSRLGEPDEGVILLPVASLPVTIN